MRALVCVGILFFALGCDSLGGKADGASSAASSKPTVTAGATASATASATPAAVGIEAFGGDDWKAVFGGEPPVELKESRGGGQGTGMADDHTRVAGSLHGHPGWKYGAITKGGIYWSSTKKVAIVENYNIKMDPTTKTVDTWIKSALVKDVKHAGGPEVLEVGTKKALALAGAGTCTMKDGSAADFYWRDVYSKGDFSHSLSIIVVGKDASDDEKKAALSMLRQFHYTDKLKPHYEKK